jgi:hypothetical protein
MPIECNREIIKMVKIMLSHTHTIDFGRNGTMVMSIFIWLSFPGCCAFMQKKKKKIFKHVKRRSGKGMFHIH